MKQPIRKDKKPASTYAKESISDGDRKKKLKPLPKQKYKNFQWEDEEE